MIPTGVDWTPLPAEQGYNFDPDTYGHCIGAWTVVPYGNSLKTDLSVCQDGDAIAQVVSNIIGGDPLLQASGSLQPVLNIIARDGPATYYAAMDGTASHLILPATLFKNRSVLTIACTYLGSLADANQRTILYATDGAGNVVCGITHKLTTRKWLFEGRDASGNAFSVESTTAYQGQDTTIIIEFNYAAGTIKAWDYYLDEVLASTATGTIGATPDTAPQVNNYLGIKDATPSQPMNGYFYHLAVYDEALSDAVRNDLSSAMMRVPGMAPHGD